MDDPHWEPEAVKRDAIPLDDADTRQLFSLLQHNQQALHQMAEAEQRRARQALGRVYRILLDAAKRAQKDAPEAEPGSDPPEAS